MRPFLACSTSAVLFVFGLGCDSPETLSCGPGTVQQGDQCVADPGAPMGMAPSGTDAGPPGAPSPSPDAGSGWSTTPPGGMGTPPAPGCDTGTGPACAQWASDLATLIAAGRDCDAPLERPEAMEGIATRHAQYQASIDGVDRNSPDGDLFDQVRDSGTRFVNAGALFSVGNRGAGDVMDRWVARAETAEVLSQCWTMAGISFATADSGWSYATVILAR